MIQELKRKLAEKNKIVDFYQRGLLSEKEFEERIADEDEVEEIEEEQVDTPIDFVNERVW